MVRIMSSPGAIAFQIGPVVVRWYGILMALSIVVLAPLLARLFGATASVTSIRWLGAVALIRGFRNWRIIQVQGDYRYAPQAVAIVVSQIASVIAIVPAAAWFPALTVWLRASYPSSLTRRSALPARDQDQRQPLSRPRHHDEADA